MAPLGCLLAHETLELPFLRNESVEPWADTIDVVTTPTPWADDICPGFMLSAIPSSSDKFGAEIEQGETMGVSALAFPCSLEAALPQPCVIGDFPSAQCMYLSPQYVPLQHGLAQMFLAVEKPELNQVSSFATTGGCAFTTIADGFNQINLYATQGVEVPHSGHCDDMIYPFPEQQAAFSSENSSDSESSSLHGSGQCKPCAWFWKKQGCHNGESCKYCHLCPEGELRSRKKAKQFLLKSANARTED